MRVATVKVGVVKDLATLAEAGIVVELVEVMAVACSMRRTRYISSMCILYSNHDSALHTNSHNIRADEQAMVEAPMGGQVMAAEWVEAPMVVEEGAGR